MQAKLVASIPAGDWIYEVKFDGYRALVLRGGPETKVLSRRAEVDGQPMPEGLDFPTVEDSVEGMAFIDAAVQSAKGGAVWAKMQTI
jgi:ATP-dependent DNA ligase